MKTTEELCFEIFREQLGVNSTNNIKDIKEKLGIGEYEITDETDKLLKFKPLRNSDLSTDIIFCAEKIGDELKFSAEQKPINAFLNLSEGGDGDVFADCFLNSGDDQFIGHILARWYLLGAFSKDSLLESMKKKGFRIDEDREDIYENEIPFIDKEGLKGSYFTTTKKGKFVYFASGTFLRDNIADGLNWQ